MTPSPACFELIEKFEGLRLEAYQDPVGIWTIGYGSTSGVHQGMTITQEQAQARLANDIQSAAECVERKVGPVLTQNEFDALVSFVFNIGCLAFSGSTLLRLLNCGDKSAANEFMRWVHAGTNVLPGLVSRRLAEKTMFNGVK